MTRTPSAVRPQALSAAGKHPGPGLRAQPAPPSPALLVDALPLDQRCYFEAQRAADPRLSPADAFATARASRTLSAADRAAVIAAQHRLAAVTPRRIDDDPAHQAQLEIAFDGATLGAGRHDEIDLAYCELVSRINGLKRARPSTAIVLVITGVGCGATAARAFASELLQRGVPDESSLRPDGSYTRGFELPRIGVMALYDTVEAGALEVSIPASAENVLHLVARDEPRLPLSSALDPSRPDDPRITELALPGSHADLCGRLPNRYARIAFHLARGYLMRAGVQVRPVDDELPDVNDPDLRLHHPGGAGPRVIHPSANRPPYPALLGGR